MRINAPLITLAVIYVVLGTYEYPRGEWGSVSAAILFILASICIGLIFWQYKSDQSSFSRKVLINLKIPLFAFFTLIFAGISIAPFIKNNAFEPYVIIAMLLTCINLWGLVNSFLDRKAALATSQ